MQSPVLSASTPWHPACGKISLAYGPLLTHSAPMLRTGTTFRFLRRERHPIVVLGIVALVARLLLVSIGLTGTVATVDASAWAEGLICTSQAGAGEPVRGHDPIHCACGPACLHLGFAPALDFSALPTILVVTAASSLPYADQSPVASLVRSKRQIRGPPQS
jgi:hypothetical protein